MQDIALMKEGDTVVRNAKIVGYLQFSMFLVYILLMAYGVVYFSLRAGEFVGERLSPNYNSMEFESGLEK